MDKKISHTQDVTRTTLLVLFIIVLLVANFWVLRPFLTAFLWATMIVVATWPVLLAAQKLLWGKRALAAGLLTLLLLLVFIVPFSIAVGTIVHQADNMVSWIKSLSSLTLPPPPQWIGSIPFLGSKLAGQWQQYSAMSSSDLAERLAPHAGQVIQWFASQAGSVGSMIYQFLLTVMIAAILYAKGEVARVGLEGFACRLIGEKGGEAVILAGKAIRGVALGVVVTAIVQSGLGGVGLAVVGMPAAFLLTIVMFMLCIAQVGPAPVLLPAIIWLYYKDGAVWGTLLLVWAIPVFILDNFLRPILIKKGADLPLLLIFAGVLGGLLALGIIGLFIGPAVLAVTYALLNAWVFDEQMEPKEELISLEQPPFAAN